MSDGTGRRREESILAGNFFRMLRQLELDGEEGSLPKGAGTVLKKLIAFVESGSCTESQAEKFIMAHFRLGGNELTKLWNRMHPESKKKAETFRGQVSLLSQYLCSLFGVSPDGLEEAFYGRDMESLGYIMNLLSACKSGDENLTERFQLLVHGGFLDAEAECSSDYEVGECSDEIRLLKAVDREAVQAMVDSVDMDKLIFVWRSIREPLVTDSYVKLQGKSRKVKIPSVNRKKLEFFRAFASAVPKELKPVTGVAQEEPLFPMLAGLPAVFADILSSGLEKYKALPEYKKQESSAKSTAESRAYCREVLEMFTEEGFRKCLNSLNPSDLAAEMEQ